MAEKVEQIPATYSAPKVLDHSEIRFETAVSGAACTPGFVKIDNRWVRVDCIEDYQ